MRQDSFSKLEYDQKLKLTGHHRVLAEIEAVTRRLVLVTEADAHFSMDEGRGGPLSGCERVL